MPGKPKGPEYRIMPVHVLNRPEYRRLTPLAKLTLWTLRARLTQTGLGIFGPGQLQDDTGMRPDHIEEVLEQLTKEGWVKRDGGLTWLVPAHGWEHLININANEKQRVHVCRQLARLGPDLPLVREWIAEYMTEPDGSACQPEHFAWIWADCDKKAPKPKGEDPRAYHQTWIEQSLPGTLDLMSVVQELFSLGQEPFRSDQNALRSILNNRELVLANGLGAMEVEDALRGYAAMRDGGHLAGKQAGDRLHVIDLWSSKPKPGSVTQQYHDARNFWRSLTTEKEG